MSSFLIMLQMCLPKIFALQFSILSWLSNTLHFHNSLSETLFFKSYIYSKPEFINEMTIISYNHELIFVILIIVSILIFIVYNRFSKIKGHKKVIQWQVDWAEEQWNFAHDQKEITEFQKRIIEEKQTQILDSINYAKRIQQSLLIPESDIKQFFNDFFIFYKPKDIVSGDFYWYKKTGYLSIVVIADCTGHGVPGAFLTMIGSTLLNEIVNQYKIVEPQKIIQALSKAITSTLITKQRIDSFDEGMDISICVINHQNHVLDFVGVNQPIYISDSAEIRKIEPQVNSIYGIFQIDDEVEIKPISIKLKTDSYVYMSTDGYADQIGGENKKKMYSKGYEKMLLSLKNIGSQSQEKAVSAYFENWKNSNIQIDDVLVVGINV